jgi:hypothetical protein
MKSLLLICALLVWAFTITTTAADKNIGTGIETVPIGKSNHASFLTIVGTWEDGSDYRPLVFLTAQPQRAGDRVGVTAAIDALIDAAIREKSKVQFTIDPMLSAHPYEFSFYAVSWRGTTIDLKTGRIETEEPTNKVAQVSTRFPQELPPKRAVVTMEHRTPKSFTLPKELSDYTVQLDYYWGIVTKRDQPTQVFVDDRIMIVGGGPSEVKPNTVHVQVQFRDEKDKWPTSVWLTFPKPTNFKDIEWHHVPSRDLKPAADRLFAETKAGRIRPPMAVLEVFGETP